MTIITIMLILIVLYFVFSRLKRSTVRHQGNSKFYRWIQSIENLYQTGISECELQPQFK